MVIACPWRSVKKGPGCRAKTGPRQTFPNPRSFLGRCLGTSPSKGSWCRQNWGKSMSLVQISPPQRCGLGLLGLIGVLGASLGFGSDSRQPSEAAPEVQRTLVSMPATVLGVSGRLFWSVLSWRGSIGPEAPQDEHFPVFWSADKNSSLPLLLLLMPDGSQPFSPPGDDGTLTLKIRPLPLFADSEPFSPKALLRPLHRQQCGALNAGAVPGWLCLRLDSVSPLVAHVPDSRSQGQGRLGHPCQASRRAVCAEVSPSF
jgi:hypothetical protein